MRSALRCHCRRRYDIKAAYQFVQFRRIEQPVRAARRDVRERRLVEPRRFNDPVLRQVIHDEIHELELIRRQRLSIREGRQCSGRANLHDHHIVFRSHGGTNARSNRVTVCAAHHLHGIHGGRTRASGTAPDAIRWELGVRPHGPPLLRLIGDRYVGT
jgi:hypothetical protein